MSNNSNYNRDQNMTDIEIFDRALYSYLSNISPNIVYSITSKALRDATVKFGLRESIPFSFISYHRDPNFEIDTDRFNFSTATFGDFVRLQSISGQREARYVKNIPVNLTYQIDIWAAKERSAQDLALRLISRIHMQNQIIITPMNPDGENARFHLNLDSWVDNSDLEAEIEKGRLYRHTITITIDSRIKLTEDVETEEFSCPPTDLYE